MVTYRVWVATFGISDVSVTTRVVPEGVGVIVVVTWTLVLGDVGLAATVVVVATT